MPPRPVESGSSARPESRESLSPTASRPESNNSMSTSPRNLQSTMTDTEENAGSKASSPSESINFRFLNFGNPQEQRNAKTRRDVRSHVTTRQHRIQRRANAEQTQADRASPSEAGPSSHVASQTPTREHSSVEEDVSPLQPEQSSPVAALRRINIAEIYPIEWHPYLRPIMDHYLQNMCIDLPSNDPTSRALLATHFMALILSDPAPIHAVMLVASSHHAKVNGTEAHSINPLQLKGMAIREINRALTEHGAGGRAISDQLIVAVAKMATYEMLFGNSETFTTHMVGLQRMVTLRGGLQALGCYGLLESSLLWLDANAATHSGALYFPPGAFSSSRGHPKPDQQLFIFGAQT